MVKRDYSYKGNLNKNVYLEDIDCKKDNHGNEEMIYALKVNEEFSLGRFDVGTYLHGRCHLFALVAHEITQMPIHILGLPDYHNPQKGEDLSTGVLLSHVYIDIGNNYTWDVSGTNELELLIDKYSEIEELIYDEDEPRFDILRNSEENFKRIQSMMKKGYIANFANGEKEALSLYIQDVIALQGHKTHTEDSETYRKIENSFQQRKTI